MLILGGTPYIHTETDHSVPECGFEGLKYRVFSKGRNAVGPFKSLIFWTFPGVLGFLDHLIWAIFHSSTFGTYD